MKQVGISAIYIEPGFPWGDRYSESINSKLRDEYLEMEEFESVRDAQELTVKFQRSYNEVRPHSALADHATGFATVPVADVLAAMESENT